MCKFPPFSSKVPRCSKFHRYCGRDAKHGSSLYAAARTHFILRLYGHFPSRFLIYQPAWPPLCPSSASWLNTFRQNRSHWRCFRISDAAGWALDALAPTAAGGGMRAAARSVGGVQRWVPSAHRAPRNRAHCPRGPLGARGSHGLDPGRAILSLPRGGCGPVGRTHTATKPGSWRGCACFRLKAQ